MANEIISQKRLKELFTYNPETGLFIRLVKTGANTKIGDIAGNVCYPGYRRIFIDGRSYGAHRLAFIYMLDYLPAQVDHKNQTPGDDRWENLRAASKRINAMNMRLFKTNTSGYCGVIWYKRDSKWQAAIVVNQKTIHLGYFDDIKDAISARKAANIKYGFSPLHGVASIPNELRRRNS